MTHWLKKIPAPIPDDIQTPIQLASFELQSAYPEISFTLDYRPELGDSFIIDRSDTGWHIAGGEKGVLYGTYALIYRLSAGDGPFSHFESHPKYSYRMINCWDNADGSIERGYSGRSLFFADGKLCWSPVRVRQLARLLASVGINTICINNVNVHYPAQELINDWLPSLSELASVFRVFGISLLISIDFSQPISAGLSTADPTDASVAAWWKKTVDTVYRFIPDLTGFLVKADSEGRPGPFTYGRTHAEGANMLADALKPHGGVLIWRCFVYNCRQNWRDTETDRPKAAWEHYACLDGSFADNVILQVKHGPFDFQVREPISPLLLGMKKTNMAMELQLAQEYTGHQIDIYTMMPMWKEIFEEMPADNIMSVAAVSNFGNDINLTGHPFAAANLFGYGLLAWDPELSPEKVTDLWIRLTYDFNSSDEEQLLQLLLSSRRTYEKYTAPLGIGWMITPHDHYGPNPSGYEYDLWGTYHKADRNAVGIDRTASGTGYLLQYPPEYQSKYSDPSSCPDLLILFYHRLPYNYCMADGRTLIQRIYDDHFEGYEEVFRMSETLKALPFPADDASVISERMAKQLYNAEEWRDIINTFFHRLSGIPDIKGRKIYD